MTPHFFCTQRSLASKGNTIIPSVLFVRIRCNENGVCIGSHRSFLLFILRRDFFLQSLQSYPYFISTFWFINFNECNSVLGGVNSPYRTTL